ncbi:porin family protein [Massilia sp. IC2-476]|uniref:porin family protein n=1 Tax=Massilia sp. IC2-476 TaxID=2887199 RepID=UPI001D102F28|nr:porin family protein [Massilia sp. IC2-476]MCC2971737.1 porin family protein [Massilia sp. IC2-476]
MKKLMIALIATAAVAGTAQAQNTPGSAYVGASAVTSKNTTVDAHKADGKLFGGYNFTEQLGVEAGWTNHHKSDFANGGVRGSTEGYGTYVAAKYTVPVNEKVSAYGKVGVSHNERKLNTNLGNIKDDDTSGYGGLGVEYKLNQNASLVAEYERYGKTKDYGARANVWSAGLKYGF